VIEIYNDEEVRRHVVYLTQHICAPKKMTLRRKQLATRIRKSPGKKTPAKKGKKKKRKCGLKLLL
jgi:hypothetical protein